MSCLRSNHVKTRKAHQCFGCLQDIPARTDSTQLVTWKHDDGEIVSIYYCAVCQAYWEKYLDNGDEIMAGSLRLDYPECWYLLKAEIEGWIVDERSKEASDVTPSAPEVA